MGPDFPAGTFVEMTGVRRNTDGRGGLMTDIVNQSDACPTGGQKPVRMGTNQMMPAQAKLSNPDIDPNFL